MRLEFNPRALCYNLYCDTREDQEKMKQMLEKGLTDIDLKNIDNMIYADTDSVRNAMKTKLNSLYGRTAMMNNNYILIHDDGKPVIIFKHHIISIRPHDCGGTRIYTTGGYIFQADEDYAKVAKLML